MTRSFTPAQLIPSVCAVLLALTGLAVPTWAAPVDDFEEDQGDIFFYDEEDFGDEGIAATPVAASPSGMRWFESESGALEIVADFELFTVYQESATDRQVVLEREFPFEEWVTAGAISDSGLAVIASEWGRVEIFERTAEGLWEQTWTYDEPNELEVTHLAAAGPDYVALALEDGAYHLYQRDSRATDGPRWVQVLDRVFKTESQITALAVSAKGLLAVGDSTGYVEVDVPGADNKWDLDASWTFDSGTHITAVGVGGETHLAVGTAQGEFAVFRKEGTEWNTLLDRNFTEHQRVTAIRVTPNGWLGLGTSTGAVLLYDTAGDFENPPVNSSFSSNAEVVSVHINNSAELLAKTWDQFLSWKKRSDGRWLTDAVVAAEEAAKQATDS